MCLWLLLNSSTMLIEVGQRACALVCMKISGPVMFVVRISFEFRVNMETKVERWRDWQKIRHGWTNGEWRGAVIDEWLVSAPRTISKHLKLLIPPKFLCLELAVEKEEQSGLTNSFFPSSFWPVLQFLNVFCHPRSSCRLQSGEKPD